MCFVRHAARYVIQGHTTTLRSKRPGRVSAASSVSGALVAAITITPSLGCVAPGGSMSTVCALDEPGITKELVVRGSKGLQAEALMKLRKRDTCSEKLLTAVVMQFTGATFGQMPHGLLI